MTTAEHAGPRPGAAATGAPARRRTPNGIWLAAVRPAPVDDDETPDFGMPTDPVDAAVRRRVSEQGGAQGVLRALLGSPLYLPADRAGAAAAHAGGRMGYATVFSDPRHAPPGAPGLIAVTADWLLAALPETTALWINPEGDAPFCVFVDDLRTVAAEPAAVLFAERHRDGTDSAPRSAHGRVRRRSAISGEPRHGHAHDGPADHRVDAPRPVPLPGP
ncbi:hypothetical protein V2S66_24680 [Streptomyces sp. V4-01]|uniref:SseB protein N-terminal domain-containing protein n=1 Tax=Actinacidiphila polyblastidii TaxID=3110430 RepID=A0ABU7PH70_9ACTN|nr:hypothetical protein [Streptomyces sp. V4-01]